MTNICTNLLTKILENFLNNFLNNFASFFGATAKFCPVLSTEVLLLGPPDFVVPIESSGKL